jgi:hypothetical protein
MKLPIKITLCFGLVALFGCASTETTSSTLISYNPNEGDHQTVSVKLLSVADNSPIPRFQPGPLFHYDSRLSGSVAKVVVDISVDEAGNVTGSKLISALPDVVGAPVAESFMRAKFTQAHLAGSPVPCTMRVTEEFGL